MALLLSEMMVIRRVSCCIIPGVSVDPDEELLFRDLFEDETQREVVIENLKADCEVRAGRPAGL